LIGKTLADDTTEQLVSAIGVVAAGRGTVGIAELKLCEIAVQMLLGAMLINATHPALEDAERAFDAVGGDVAANVLGLSVILCAGPVVVIR
jgi:hypothetical protein